MTRSIVGTVLIGVVLAACSAPAVRSPQAAEPAASFTAGFEPYCGQIWSVAKQGYLEIPCPPGSGYLK